MEDVVVRGAKHRQAFAPQPYLALGVVLYKFVVDGTVGFHDQGGIAAEEVDDEASDGGLASKLEASKTVPSQE
jgi:hypothetical protein